MVRKTGKVTLCTYNSTGLNQGRTDFIEYLISNRNPDLLLLQETWLLGSQLFKLSSLHPDYIAHGISGMNDREDLISGRRYGGLAILWRKSLAAKVKPLRTDNSRLCAVMLTLSGSNILLLNAYLPCDNYSSTMPNALYQAVLDDALRLWLESDADRLIFGGDLNTDPRRNNAHSSALADFISSVNCESVWQCANVPLMDTYVSYDERGRSCIDHFFVSKSLSSHVCNVYVHQCPLNGSNHSPLLCDINVYINVPPIPRNETDVLPSIAWGRITNEHIESYKFSVVSRLDALHSPVCFTECLGVCCNSVLHKCQIDEYCEQFCNICIESGRTIFPMSRPNALSKPKWKELIKPVKDEALFWDAIWKDCGKPTSGYVREIRQKTKREYHYALRQYKKCEKTLRRERMGEELARNRMREFWVEVSRVGPKKSVLAPVIDGATTQQDISELFVCKYDRLFNSVQSSDDDLHSLTDEIDASLAAVHMVPDAVVELEELNQAIRKLKKQKHDGNRSFWSNFIIWLPRTARKYLSMLLSAMLSHGHTPACINIGTIISIPKDSSGDICSSDNYRGIALSSSISKLMEVILIAKSGTSISSSNLQFAYKAKHGTSMCTLLLKETANYFINQDGGVYCALVDASKAFDRLRHDKLFGILMQRGVPAVIIRYLIDNYRRQKMLVKWGNVVSRAFGVANGVKQGGILSPILFNVYMDTLLERLQNHGVGCHLGDAYVGALAYADDLTLLSPSLNGLQSMLKLCEEFGNEYAVTFNPVKTQCIRFCRERDPGSYEIYLDGKKLKWVKEVKHLGHIISFNLSESSESKRKIGDFIYHVNALRANFKGVSFDILLHLFNAHCTSFYGSQSWDLNQPCFQSIYTKFNRGVRILFNLPFRTHCNILPVLLDTIPLELQLAKRFMKMFFKMTNSPNPIVKSVTDFLQNDCRSIIRKNIFHFDALSAQYSSPSDQLICTCFAIKEILSCLYGDNLLSPLSRDDLEFFLLSLCTD